MKRMIFALAVLALSASQASAAWEQDAAGSWTWKAEAVPVGPSLVVIPPGHHAHRMIDGTTIVHADSNFGSATAHQGVAGANWPKTGFPGQTVAVDPFSVAGPCPGGVCPAPASRRTATASVDVFGYTMAATMALNAPRPVRGVFSWLRAHRPHVFGGRRAGCP